MLFKILIYCSWYFVRLSFSMFTSSRTLHSTYGYLYRTCYDGIRLNIPVTFCRMCVPHFLSILSYSIRFAFYQYEVFNSQSMINISPLRERCRNVRLLLPSLVILIHIYWVPPKRCSRNRIKRPSCWSYSIDPGTPWPPPLLPWVVGFPNPCESGGVGTVRISENKATQLLHPLWSLSDL